MISNSVKTNLLKYENMNERFLENERLKKIHYKNQLLEQIQLNQKFKEEQKRKKDEEDKRLEEKIKNDLKKLNSENKNSDIFVNGIEKTNRDFYSKNIEEDQNRKKISSLEKNKINFHNFRENKNNQNNQYQYDEGSKMSKNSHLPIIHTFNFNQVARKNDTEDILMRKLEQIEKLKEEEKHIRNNLEKKIDFLNDVINSKFQELEKFQIQKNTSPCIPFDYLDQQKFNYHLPPIDSTHSNYKYISNKHEYSQKNNIENRKDKNSNFQNYARNYLKNEENYNNINSAPKYKNSLKKNSPAIKKKVYFTPNIENNRENSKKTPPPKKPFQPKNLFNQNPNAFLKPNLNNLNSLDVDYFSKKEPEPNIGFSKKQHTNNNSNLLDTLSHYLPFQNEHEYNLEDKHYSPNLKKKNINSNSKINSYYRNSDKLNDNDDEIIVNNRHNWEKMRKFPQNKISEKNSHYEKDFAYDDDDWNKKQQEMVYGDLIKNGVNPKMENMSIMKNNSKSMFEIYNNSNDLNSDNSINGALNKYNKLSFEDLKKSIDFDNLINLF